jgi:maleate isomerase
MYGWRARIGLMIAHSNTIMEPEFNRVMPEGVSVHASRVRIEKITVDGLRDMNRNVDRALEDLSEIGASVFAYACTAASFVGSAEEDRQVKQRIEERMGRPAVTAAGSVLRSLERLKAKRISVATPYPAPVNEKVKAFLESQGFEVVNIDGVDFGKIAPYPPLSDTPVSHPGLQPPHMMYKIARSCFAEGSDALFVSAAGVRTFDVIEHLEADLGVPVISSGQAIMREALEAAGVRSPISGYGRLLRFQD